MVDTVAFSRFDPKSLLASALDPIALSNTRTLFFFCLRNQRTPPNEGSVKIVSPFVLLFFGDVEEDDAFFFPVAFVALSPAEDEEGVEEEGADFFFCFLSPDANDPFPFVLVPDDDVDVSFEAPSPPLPPNNAFT